MKRPEAVGGAGHGEQLPIAPSSSWRSAGHLLEPSQADAGSIVDEFYPLWCPFASRRVDKLLCLSERLAEEAGIKASAGSAGRC